MKQSGSIKQDKVTKLEAGTESILEPNPIKQSGLEFKLDWAVLAILGLGLLLRLYVMLVAPHPNPVIDEAEYYQIASILSDGRGWLFYEDATWIRPPLYVLFLAANFKLFGPNLIIIRFLQIGLSLGSMYLLYRLGLKIFNRRTGLIAAFLAAIAWPFVVLPFLLLSETLFMFLFLAAVTLLTEFVALKSLNKQNRRLFLLLPAAGILLGLAALTRGQVLSFIPFILIWLFFSTKLFTTEDTEEVSSIKYQVSSINSQLLTDNRQPTTNNPSRLATTLLACGLILLFFGLTIAPWLYRNYSTYGRFFIDTTGGHNFYLGALAGRNGALVSQTLLPVKNLSERELLGYRKGLEVAMADPASFVQKGFKETLDFWQIDFGASERLLTGYTKGLIPPAWLIPDALLDDLLYIIVGTLAALGLIIAPASSGHFKSFTLIWLGYNLALAFAFFGVTRFRLPVYYFLFIFAAYTLANWRQVLNWLNRPLALNTNKGRALRVAAGLSLPALFLIIVLPSYTPQETFVGLEKWNQQQHVVAGDDLRRQGLYDAAKIEYAKAEKYNPYTQIGLGLTEAAQGNYEQALLHITRTSQDISETHLALGAIYLLQNNREYAQAEFNSRQIANDANADKWAWDNLPTPALANNLLELGKFDWGYVWGFQNPEKDIDNGKSVSYRWTGGRGDDGQGRARLRFPSSASANTPNQPKTLQIRLKGYRPENLKPPLVEVWANGRSLGQFQTGRDWQTFTLNLPPDLPAGSKDQIIIEIGANTFVPSAASRRELGVMLEWAKLD